MYDFANRRSPMNCPDRTGSPTDALDVHKPPLPHIVDSTTNASPIGTKSRATTFPINPALEVFETNAIIQTCSRIFSPDPIGIGTSEVESISSYAQRTSEVLCLKITDFMDFIVKPAMGWSKHYKLSHLPHVETAPALESLTNRSNLMSMTLDFWRHAISPDDMYRKSAAWCPECFAEWKTKDVPLYLPLKWSLTSIYTCQKHNRQLSRQCPYCNCDNFKISPHLRIGYCPACKNWLGHSDCYKPARLLTKSETTEQVWAHLNIDLLLTKTFSIKRSIDKNRSLMKAQWRRWRPMRTAHFSEINYQPGYFLFRKDFVGQYVNRVFDGKVDLFAFTFDISLERAWDLYLSHKLPTLSDYLSFSCFIKVPLLSFILQGSSQPSPGEVRLMKKNDLTLKSPGRSTRKLHTFKKKLVELLNDDYPPYSFHDIAIQLGCTKSFLRQHFPEQTSRLLAKYAAYQKIPCWPWLTSARQEIIRSTVWCFVRRIDPCFHSKVTCYSYGCIEYHATPVILEWVSTMRKLGYAMETIRTRHGLHVGLRRVFHSDKWQLYSFSHWDLIRWKNDLRLVLPAKSRPAGK